MYINNYSCSLEKKIHRASVYGLVSRQKGEKNSFTWIIDSLGFLTNRHVLSRNVCSDTLYEPLNQGCLQFIICDVI